MSQNTNRSVGDKKPVADKEHSYISSIEAYEIEWSQLNLLAEENNLDRIRQFAIGGLLNVSKFRSVYWCLLLGVLKGNIKSWVLQKSTNRVEYIQLKKDCDNNPHVGDAENKIDDPLSQSGNSTWNQYFCDQELRAVIKQDVHRTGIDFFRKPEIQAAMIDILFCYARKNPSICYRQGMHEILAPIIFVLYNDLQILEHIKETKSKVDEVLIELLQIKYLEADAFAIFTVVMERIAEPYYRIYDMTPEATGHFPALQASPGNQKDKPQVEIEIIEQLNRIKDNILSKHDPMLCEHLTRLNIPLSIFGVRWLRLLFGREFSMPNLLLLWDAIFAESTNYSLVDYIFVACLIHIRDKLLQSDCNTALTYLMHYPSVDSIAHILRQAQVMKNTFDKATVMLNKKAVKPQDSGLPQVSNRRPQSKFLTKTQSPASNNNGLKSQSRPVTDPSFADTNFSDEKNIELLKSELQDSYKIMEISQMKLQQYLFTLKRHVGPKTPENILQVLDGMEELCSLLRSKQPLSLVEPAIEANEVLKSITRPPVVPVPLNITRNSPEANTQESNGYVKPEEKLDQSLEKIFSNRKEIEMDEFKHDFVAIGFDDISKS